LYWRQRRAGTIEPRVRRADAGPRWEHIMAEDWPAVAYERRGATCDTLHAHTQVLGKLAVELAPPEPELLHAALRLTARGWETGALRAPDGSGSLVVALDLNTHEAVVEHSRGLVQRVPLVPDRPVAEVTRDVLAAVARAGGAVHINPVPQEVPWSVHVWPVPRRPMRLWTRLN